MLPFASLFTIRIQTAAFPSSVAVMSG